MARMADQIAARFGNDGQRFEDAKGSTIADTCDNACVAYGKARSAWNGETREYEYVEVPRGESAYDAMRYEFEDGSAIVIAGDGWDVEGARHFSWAGV